MRQIMGRERIATVPEARPAVERVIDMAQPAVLMTAVLVSVSVAGVAVGSDLVFTEGFEQGREQWTPAATGTLDNAEAHRGTAGLKIHDGAGDAYSTVDCRVSLQPDSLYELTYFVLSHDSRNATMCIIQLDDQRRMATFEGHRLVKHCFPLRDGAVLGQWQQATARFTTGPTVTSCTLRLNPADGSREHKGTVWFDDIALSRIRGRTLTLFDVGARLEVPHGRPAEDSLPLTPLAPFVLGLASPSCAILCSEDLVLRAAAKTLASAIARAGEPPPRILDDAVDPATLGRGPVVVMGSLTLGVAARRLYFTGYDFTDYSWPGKGGYVVRTIRDPFGTGAHVLMLGGSFPKDIAAAAHRAVRIVADSGPKLGYLNVVKLGANADAIKARSETFLSSEPTTWKRIGGNGSWNYIKQIHWAGMGFLRTGDEAYLKPFCRELLWFFYHDVINRPDDLGPAQIHSTIDDLLLLWDLVADHPAFAKRRTDIDEKFLFLACSGEGGRPMRRQGWQLRSNHGIGRALDSYFLGRYFQRRYGIEEGNEWMQIADNHFLPQMQAFKSYEDNSYHQFHVSLALTLYYALATGKEDYIGGDVLRQIMDRAIIAHRVGRGPATYLSAYATAIDDPRYLALMACRGSDGYIEYCAGMSGASVIGENLRAFCGFTQPATHDELLGVAVAPLDPIWHESMRSRTDGGQFLVTTPAEHCFDKIAVRDGFRPEDFYMLIDGLCGGGHSFQDSNCIVQYQDHGYPWLKQEYGNFGPTCSTVRQQNGVFVALDGQGPGAVHRCARLLYARKLGAGHDAVGSALEGIGDIDWQRHILRKKGAWTLVIDRAVANRAGEAYVERNWHVRGDATATADGLIAKQGEHVFHLQSAGLSPDAMSGAGDRTEIVRAHLDAHESVEIASLIHVDRPGSDRVFRLEQASGGWRVYEAEDVVNVTVGPDGIALSTAMSGAVRSAQTLPLLPAAPDVELPWATMDVGNCVTAVAVGNGRVAAGTQGGIVAVYGFDSRLVWRKTVTSKVLSLHFVQDDLLVGENNGTLSRYDPSGKQRWSVTIPYETLSWAHWSLKRSSILEIASADIDRDGAQEILISNGDARVYAFSGSGKQLWRHRVKWGLYTAMTPIIDDGAFALLGGARGPTLRGRLFIIDAHGKHAGGLNCPSMESQRFRDLRRMEPGADGNRKIICTRDVSNRQLMCSDGKRNTVWHADVGGSPTALALRTIEGRAQALCASLCGYIHAFDARTGRRDWLCYVGDRAEMLWPRRDGSVVAVCASGKAFVLDAGGALVGQEQLGVAVTALLRTGDHRASPAILPVGTEDGTLRLLRP